MKHVKFIVELISLFGIGWIVWATTRDLFVTCGAITFIALCNSVKWHLDVIGSKK